MYSRIRRNFSDESPERGSSGGESGKSRWDGIGWCTVHADSSRYTRSYGGVGVSGPGDVGGGRSCGNGLSEKRRKSHLATRESLCALWRVNSHGGEEVWPLSKNFSKSL